MREIRGELWDYYHREDKPFVVCITTNGFVKKNGEAVMGRGCAYEATKRIPYIAKDLGELIKLYGNRPWGVHDILTFPVKHNWWESADLELIRQSAETLRTIALDNLEITYVLPRPGCGNGRLDWAQVKPLLEDLPDNVWVISR
jgi:hypothetical protein